MKTKTIKKITGMITAMMMVFGIVVTGTTTDAQAAAANSKINGLEKSYAQFNKELADAMSKIGDHEIARIEVNAKPFVSVGRQVTQLLAAKEGIVLEIDYESDGKSRNIVLLPADAALADENGYLGFDYVYTEKLKAVKEKAEAAGVSLSDGLVPITWKPSSQNLIIRSSEARAFYAPIKAGNYPDVETLQSSNITAQIDELSAYYTGVYGTTSQIDTPEREELREHIRAKFLSAGSARTQSIDFSSGKHHYVYDGPLDRGYEMELVLGLPAAGKSTRVTDPDSEAMHAFILDCDEVKELIPEFRESHGAAADAVHLESFEIMDSAMKEFTEGSLKGVNVIIPIVAGDFDDLMNNYIKPFEEAGYNVRAKFVDCEVKASVSRNIMRELETGRIIKSTVVFSFGEKPKEVFEKLAPMINSKGITYGVGYEDKAVAKDDAA